MKNTGNLFLLKGHLSKFRKNPEAANGRLQMALSGNDILNLVHKLFALITLLTAAVVGYVPYATFLVFLYIWMPYMILPVQAALERVPGSLVEASSDLGAKPGQSFRMVILPLAFPGVVAGSIFTFSLTLGDYIIPGIIGSSRFFIGQAVFAHQGTAGNIPLAAAFSVVPIVIMAFYLFGAKKLGAFDVL